ncbi:response regulator [Sphingomonas sp. NBWT7]|nr:response regulator [Sphingomonas sp. NBWT7]
MIFGRRKRSIVRLLVVEDEPLVAFDVEHMLTDQKFEIVATVDRVTDALAIIASGAEIHLVLVDVVLADGSGVEVARAAQVRGIPVMFVTGHCPGEAEAVANGCLSKPYSDRDLVGAIRAIEASHEGRKPSRLPVGFRLFDRDRVAIGNGAIAT